MKNGSQPTSLTNNMIESTLFKRIEVFEKLADGSTAVYVCFEQLDTKLFFVQSLDYVGVDRREERIASHQQQVHSLFQDALPNERMIGCSTLQEAIATFKALFS